MKKILPAINTTTFEAAREQMQFLSDLTDRFHLDISKGDFANFETWQNPKEFERLPHDWRLTLDVHLMVRLEPLSARPWCAGRVKRVIFHAEATSNPEGVIKVIHKAKREAFIAINPRTPLSAVEDILLVADGIVFLGVDPGQSGQPLQQEAVAKLKTFQKPSQEFTVGFDGGVKLDTIEHILPHVDFVCVGSAIFKAADPRESFKQFARVAAEQ